MDFLKEVFQVPSSPSSKPRNLRYPEAEWEPNGRAGPVKNVSAAPAGS